MTSHNHLHTTPPTITMTKTLSNSVHQGHQQVHNLLTTLSSLSSHHQAPNHPGPSHLSGHHPLPFYSIASLLSTDTKATSTQSHSQRGWSSPGRKVTESVHGDNRIASKEVMSNPHMEKFVPCWLTVIPFSPHIKITKLGFGTSLAITSGSRNTPHYLEKNLFSLSLKPTLCNIKIVCLAWRIITLKDCYTPDRLIEP